MIIPLRASYKINKYHKKNIIAVNYENVVKNLSEIFDVPLNAVKIKSVFERPFSIILYVIINKKIKEYIFIKIYKIKNYEKQLESIINEFKISRFWFEKFRPYPGFSVIEPIWLDSKNLIIISRKSPGLSLLKLINKTNLFSFSFSKNKILKGLERAGNWLKIFQTFPVDEPVPFVKKDINLSIEYFQEYLKIRMNKMVQNPYLNFEKEDENKVINYLQEQWNLIKNKKENVCFSHTDFSLSNILISEQQVTVLDFGKCEINFIYKDTARLIHQLYLLSFKPSFSVKFINEMQQAFLDGYGQPFAQEHPLFKIFFLIHQVTHLGKISRYWERGKLENIYNRFLVRQVLSGLRKTVLQ